MGGCVSGRQTTPKYEENSPQELRAEVRHDHAEKALLSLLDSYMSIYTYIQSLRKTAYDRLFANLEVNQLNQLRIHREDVEEMELFDKDMQYFRLFRRLNRYKYKSVHSTFIANIRECLPRIKQIDGMNMDSLELLNTYRNDRSEKLSKRFRQRIADLCNLIIRVRVYLESDQEAEGNLNLSCNYYNIELTSVTSNGISGRCLPLQRFPAATASSSKNPDEENDDDNDDDAHPK